MKYALPGFSAVLLSLVVSLQAEKPSTRDGGPPLLRLFTSEFVPVTPGSGLFPASYRMGSDADTPLEEKPAHVVRFARSFAIAKYEVTQELYEFVKGANPSRWKGPRNSVELVSWSEANQFCERITQLLNAERLLGEGSVIRLPTEAEWEYACRAGTQGAYTFGDATAGLRDYAWFKENSKGEDPPVGRKKPNAWGLHDMHGYVWEWCADTWHPTYEGAPTDGSSWTDKSSRDRVLRGGSWGDSAERCRSAARHHLPLDTRSDTLGFRCVRMDPPK